MRSFKKGDRVVDPAGFVGMIEAVDEENAIATVVWDGEDSSCDIALSDLDWEDE